MSKILVFFIGLTLLFIPTHQAHAATFDVCTFAELEAAITAANTNGQADTINFNCSTPVIFTSALVIADDGAGNDITINGNTNIIFDGNNATYFFMVNGGASLTVDGLTLQNGNSSNGGAILNIGTLTISNSTLSGNLAGGVGGAIYNTGTVTIGNSLFTNNSSGNGGAIFNTVGTVTITNSNFINNSADFGGAISNNITGTVNITNSAFTSNSATTAAGAIYNDPTSTLTITNSTFISNSATTSGGGAIYNIGTVNITNNIFISNFAGGGGAIYHDVGTITIIDSEFRNNLGTFGTAIFSLSGTVSSQDSHYETNTCNGTITDNGGNTVINATGCPGTAPIPLDVSALTCNGNNAEFTINNGDANFDITDTTAGVSITNSPAGLITLTGPATWTDVTITERRGEREFINIGGISCPDAVIIPPATPVTSPVTVLGCALDSTDGIELANAPDNTYCRILMKNGAVISYSGAIPAELIGLGVILAVDVYRLEGGMSINTFPAYARICLSGAGRYFYMDGRNAPRYSVEMPTERVDGLTCAWIPAPGTVILTN